MIADSAIKLLTVPFPYKGLLAICSDLDETPTDGTYFELAKFLNTGEETRFGRGVNLEVGNTIYFEMPPGQFSYGNASDSDRRNIRNLVRSGHIDCIHSYGDLADTREKAIRCLEELQSQGCQIDVWVDHAQAPSNLDPGIMQGSGALANGRCYHADLTCGEYGVSFVWKGRVTSIVGQNCKRSYQGIFDRMQFLPSSVTVLKEWLKGVLGRLGSGKYRMHAGNRVLRKTCLADQTPVYEFMRFNPSPFGVSRQENAPGFGEVVTKAMIESLIDRGAVGVLYTHLGKGGALTRKSIAAFRMLASYCQSSQLLIVTTRRLLGYLRATEALQFKYRADGQTIIIDITGELPMADLQGLSWKMPVSKVQVNYNGAELRSASIVGRSREGDYVAQIPWEPLIFPSLEG